MQNARKLHLPVFSQSEKMNRKQKQILRDDITDWIRNHNGGWSTHSHANSTHGKHLLLV
jgi:hypothetical protein